MNSCFGFCRNNRFDGSSGPNFPVKSVGVMPSGSSAVANRSPVISSPSLANALSASPSFPASNSSPKSYPPSATNLTMASRSNVDIIPSNLSPIAASTSPTPTTLNTRFQTQDHLVFKNSQDFQLGATFFSLFKALDNYDKGKFAGMNVVFDSGRYLDVNVGPNWWEYFFKPICLKKGEVDKEISLSIQETRQNLADGYKLPSYRLAYLFKKYIAFRPEIVAEINSYIKMNFSGKYIIGVHHRGTDRSGVKIPFTETLTVLRREICRVINYGRDLRIFVATDDADFLRNIKKLYPKHVLHYNVIRSTDDEPLHFSQTKYDSNYQKGKEAIFDLFLLSGCDTLIHPSFSSFSSLAAALRLNFCQVVRNSR